MKLQWIHRHCRSVGIECCTGHFYNLLSINKNEYISIRSSNTQKRQPYVTVISWSLSRRTVSSSSSVHHSLTPVLDSYKLNGKRESFGMERKMVDTSLDPNDDCPDENPFHSNWYSLLIPSIVWNLVNDDLY